MSVIALQFLGRFGNCMFSYAFARAYAEKHGLELQTDPWIGQQIFGLKDPPITATNLRARNENDLVDGEKDIIFRSYCQQQKCLIYTRSDCRRWFQFEKWVNYTMASISIPLVCAHRRVGDYVGYSFPYVSEFSYYAAAKKFDLPSPVIITEENPTRVASLGGELAFLPDFYLLTKTPVLLRGNSSFSWWASVLNHGITYSPVIDGLGAGEHNVDFVLGNHPRLSHHSFCTDLYLKE